MNVCTEYWRTVNDVEVKVLARPLESVICRVQLGETLIIPPQEGGQMKYRQNYNQTKSKRRYKAAEIAKYCLDAVKYLR